MHKLVPEVSAWYQDRTSGNLFEVVAIDEDSGTIEVQLLDGEVGEYDASTWNQLPLVAAEAPEDWRSSYELSEEDGLDSDAAQVPENYSGALSDIEPDLLDLGDDFNLL